MENSLVYGFLLVILFGTELVYFSIAEHFAILDKPNERSSHARPVVRGGGMIFVIALIFWFLWFGFQWPYFIAGVVGAGIISFMDDIKSQPPLLRFSIHFIAVLLIFFSIGLFSWPIWLWLPALIVCIGTMNAFNFMDGINGITGIYAIVTLGTFIYINELIVPFTDRDFLFVNTAAVLVFLFFNFRKRARCFAGDVGSVTIAFVLIFLLLQLIYKTENLLWVILFMVYGTDSVVTIIFRLRRKENIFQPHRTHLYQYLCNELRWPHRLVSALYGMAQLLINSILIFAIVQDNPMLAIGVGVATLLIYLFIRSRVVSKIGGA